MGIKSEANTKKSINSNTKNTKELASSLGLTIQELVSITGYTRQGLWNIINGNQEINKPRMKIAINELRRFNQQRFQKEYESVIRANDLRERAIDEFSNALGVSQEE